MRFEVATWNFIFEKLGIQKIFFFFWRRKSFRNLINLPRRLSFRLKGKRRLGKRSDAIEIARVATELKEHGIAISSIENFSEMPTTSELQKEYNELLAKEAEAPHSRKFKPFIERLIDDDYDFSTNKTSAIYRFVSNPALKITAENYLNLVPKLTSFKIWRSHFTGNLSRTASQNWHRDYNEFQMVRIFLYFNDVDVSNGAGQYVSGSHYLGDSYNKLEYSEESGTYATDEEIAENFSGDRIVCATGKAGTLVFMDTAGLHRGGFHTNEGERRVSLLTFSTAADIMPTRVKLRARLIK